MRIQILKQYCVNCEYRTRLKRDFEEKLFAEKGHLTAHIICYGYDKNGRELRSMKETMCPMIKDAKETLKKLDIEKKENSLKICERNIARLIERKAKLEKELEELRNS